MAHELAHAWMEAYDPQHKTSEFHDKHQRVLDSVTTENFVPTPPTTYCANVPA
jgi:Zn-dependent peptidase ImmA (M78 family)